MRLYDTLRQRVEPFTPSDGRVKLYVCGVTPYDTTHMGHAFTYVCFDVLARYLEFCGYPVRYVQNVTDIDDDILRRANELGVAWDDLARQETARYLQDMRDLNVRPVDVMPRATEEVPKILEIDEALLKNGWAYENAGNVYFRVRQDPEYGKLSKLRLDEMLPVANERGNNPNDPYKEDPLDFVLWQAAQPGEPTWNSPWGPGRPGWHIECSAMSIKYLGDQLDIHGGGADLVFPHHESEIAQSEHYTGKTPFVRFWVHTAMVYCGGEKMSKSLGNLVMVRDELRRYSADTVRLYLLSHHYRRPWQYAMDGPATTAKLAQRLSVAANSTGGAALDLTPFQAEFVAAMDDDLDTPRAIAALDALARAILAEGAGGAARQALRRYGGVLGLQLHDTVE